MPAGRRLGKVHRWTWEEPARGGRLYDSATSRAGATDARCCPSDTRAPDARVDLSGTSRHSRAKDVYALAIGTSFVVLGLVFLKTAGRVTGGVAGLALLLSYLLPLEAGTLFTLINIPFFMLARATMGTASMVKTIVVNLSVTLLAALAPALFAPSRIDGMFAAVAGGTIIGMGILSLARHGAGRRRLGR